MFRLRNNTKGILIIGVSVILGFVLYRETNPKPGPTSYVLPHDDFNQATMNQIWNDIHQWNVQTLPQDHEVYVLTGGLGMANPTIMYADSNGNFDFAPITTHMPDYSFKEWKQSPENWSYTREKGGVSMAMGASTPPPVDVRIPWKSHISKLGVIYYEWDMAPGEVYFYFKEPKSYISVHVDFIFPPKEKILFPEGILRHLTPIENPIT